MGEIDQLEDAVDEGEAERQQRVHRAEAEPVDDLLQQNRVEDHAQAITVGLKLRARYSMARDCFVAALLAKTAPLCYRR